MIEKESKLAVHPISMTSFSLTKNFKSAKTAISVFLAIAIIFLLSRNTSWSKLYGFIKEAKVSYLFVAFLCFYGSILFRAFRWNLLLKRLEIFKPLPEVSEIYFLSWFANCIVPGKIGDLYRAYLVWRNYGYAISRVMGSIFSERFFDLIVIFSLYLSIGIYWFRAANFQGFPVLAGGGLVAIWALGGIILLMKKGGEKIRNKLPPKLADIYTRFEGGTFLSLRGATLTLTLSVAIWILEAMRLFYVMSSVQLKLPILLVIFMALTSSLLTALPITPAGLGVVEVSLVNFLVLYGYEQDVALGVVILDRLISYWSIVFLGYMVFLLGKKS